MPSQSQRSISKHEQGDARRRTQQAREAALPDENPESIRYSRAIEISTDADKMTARIDEALGALGAQDYAPA